MLKNGRNDDHCSSGLAYAGCSCHNSKQSRRRSKHSVKRREARQWKADVR